MTDKIPFGRSEFSVPDAQADHILLLFGLLVDPVCVCGAGLAIEDATSRRTRRTARLHGFSLRRTRVLPGDNVAVCVWDLADFFVIGS